MVANQAAKLAFSSLFGNQFDPAITGMALETGDVGLFHVGKRTLSRAQRKRPSTGPSDRNFVKFGQYLNPDCSNSRCDLTAFLWFGSRVGQHSGHIPRRGLDTDMAEQPTVVIVVDDNAGFLKGLARLSRPARSAGPLYSES
jgi:hypothetical protein